MIEDIKSSIHYQVQNEFLLNRLVNHAYCGAQADRLLDKLKEINEAQRAAGQGTKLEEETSEFEDLANALSSLQPDSCKPVSLLEYLQSKTLELGCVQVEFFKVHGKNRPPPPSEQEKKTTICWRDLLRFSFVSARDSNFKPEENYYTIMEGFQHETLFIRDMILTCVTYNFRNDKNKLNQETQVTSTCELDLPTYREKYVVHDLLSWYGLEDVNTTRYPSKIWTTKQLYQHVREVILEDLYSDTAMAIAKSRGMNIAENAIRNYRLGMPGPSNVTKQETPNKLGQGSSKAQLEVPVNVEERLSPLKSMKQIGVAITRWLNGKKGKPDDTSMEVDHENLYFPSMTNVQKNEKASSTATLKSGELCDTDVVIYKKNTWSALPFVDLTSALATALLSPAVIGSAVGSPVASAAVENEAANRMVLRPQRNPERNSVRKLFSRK